MLNLPIEVDRKLKNSVDPPQKTTSKIYAEKKNQPKICVLHFKNRA